MEPTGWPVGAMVVLVLAVCGGGMPAAAQQVVDMPAEDRPLASDFEEVYRVGTLDGAEWEIFGDIAGTAFDGDGNLYVLDRQASQVTVVTPEGTLLRTVGGPGDGPGELRSPAAFTVMPDGRVVIADLGHRAYQIFRPDGEFERMVGMGDGDVIRIGDIAPHPDGESVVSGGGSTAVSMRRGRGDAPEMPTGRPVDRIGLGGDEAVSTTIVEGWLPPRPDRPQELSGGGMRFRMTVAGPRTFEPSLLVGVLPDGGIAFADSSAYAIKVTDAAGEIGRILRRPIDPRPVTEAIRKAERERRLAELEAGEGPRMRVITSQGGGAPQPVPQDAIREMMRGQIEGMEFYPELPVLVELSTTWGGKIWAQRRGGEPTEAGAIDVMTADGRYMGTFSPSETAMPDAFGPDGLAAFVELDELDVPMVVVRRLPAILN